MSTTYCRHVRTNGRRCRSAAMRGKSLCYFHEGVNTRKRALNPPIDPTPTIIHPMHRDPDYLQRDPLVAEYYGIKPKGPLELDFPAIEDADSVQVALSMVIAALGKNIVDSKRATTLLYALQVASANTRNLSSTSNEPTVLETVFDEAGNELAPDEDPQEPNPRKGPAEEMIDKWLSPPKPEPQPEIPTP